MKVAMGAAGIAIPSVPTIGNAETLSGPWVTRAVALVPVTGAAAALNVLVIITPLTVPLYVPPTKLTLLATV